MISEEVEKLHQIIRKKILSTKEFTMYDIAISIYPKKEGNKFYRIYGHVFRVVNQLKDEGRVSFYKYEIIRMPPYKKSIYRVI